MLKIQKILWEKFDGWSIGYINRTQVATIREHGILVKVKNEKKHMPPGN